MLLVLEQLWFKVWNLTKNGSNLESMIAWMFAFFKWLFCGFFCEKSNDKYSFHSARCIIEEKKCKDTVTTNGDRWHIKKNSSRQKCFNVKITLNALNWFFQYALQCVTRCSVVSMNSLQHSLLCAVKNYEYQTFKRQKGSDFWPFLVWNWVHIILCPLEPVGGINLFCQC